jgi:hypothetical protein
MDGGQRHGEQLRVFHIIHAHDFEIARNLMTAGQKSLHGTQILPPTFEVSE